MAALRLDPFYLIVDDADWLSRLLPQGVKLVQLRVKDRAEPDLRAQIATAREMCARHGAQLVVNDYWRLAIEEGCDFVHLGQGDLDAADIPALRRAGVRIGVSTHDEAELDRALSLERGLCRARPDLSHAAETNGLCAAGPRPAGRLEGADRRDASRRHRRTDPRTRHRRACRGRGQRLRRHRHFAQRRSGGARAGMALRDATLA